MIIVTVFTKDRLDRSERTFTQWRNSPYPVFVLDDSHSETNRARNLIIARENGLIYHGPSEQQKFLSQMGMTDLFQFTGRLGNKTWNLGNNRNYALILTVATGHRFVILCDDDVLVDRITLLRVGRDLESGGGFVGAQITGMLDDSIVGHLYRQAGRIVEPQYTSGTFLGVDSSAVSLPFANFYNEDWIWLCIENQGHNVEQTYCVEQLYYDPFFDWKERVFFQEEGEILWEGVYEAVSKSCTNDLSSVAFWIDVIKQRRSRIKSLISLILPERTKNIAVEIQQTLLNHLDKLDSQHFSNTINTYLHSADNWRRLYRKAKRIGSSTHTQVDIRF